GLTGGEPLLDKNLELYLREIRDHGMVCDINTNATLMNEEKAELLRKYDVFLYVSLDGATKSVHEKIRGTGTWDPLMRGLKIVKKKGLEFSTVFAISKLNYFETGEYVKLSEKLGAVRASMIPIMPVGRAGEDIVPSREELYQALKSAEKSAREIGYQMNVWCFGPAKLIIDPRFVSTWSDCRRGRVIDIDPSGDILLCDVLDIVVGNVRSGFEKGLEEYRKNPFVKRVMNPVLREPCKSCPLRDECMGGCYARSLIYYGTLDGPDPYCPRVKLFEDERLRGSR
ncbi:MAG: radical SAM protein, partial [Thaumarchaeota archaeon]|nr:radical SAM protein [Nitrososphaerota archaeon]